MARDVFAEQHAGRAAAQLIRHYADELGALRALDQDDQPRVGAELPAAQQHRPHVLGGDRFAALGERPR